MIVKLIYKLQKFMYGRYGVDELYKFLFYLYLCLAFINIFIKNAIMVRIEFVIIFIAIYRSLSKNIKQRRKENKLYLKVMNNICKPFINIKRNLYDKYHIYKRCSCGTTIKLPLPKKYGIKHTKCPDCKRRIAFLALKKEKPIIIPKAKEMEG